MKREGGAMWFWISLSHHQRSGGEEKTVKKDLGALSAGDAAKR